MAEKKKRQPAKKKAQAATKATKLKKSTKAKITKTTDFPIVGLGASAGGLEALETFFSNMPSGSNIAFVIIQHLSPKHKSIMASLLSKSTEMPVTEIKSGTLVEPNHVYLNPPDKNVVIQNGKLQLMMPIRSDGLNLPIDCFFRSMASDLNEKAVCVILSGTATDGTLGLKAIKGNGGIAMVQDPNSAKYDGMPRSAIATGIVDFILPVEKLPGELVKYVKAPYITLGKIAKTKDDNFAEYIQTIFALIRESTGHDLAHYKQTTIRRRIERRMAVHQIGKIDGYVKYLKKNNAEVEILFKDMLIGVTNFFRDPEAFEILKNQVLPGLFKSRQPDSLIRIWIVGCSTGEEAYSMMILLLEVMDMIKQHHNVQVFASDIDADAIEQGRLGVYPDSIAADVSQERLNKYFIKEDNTYRIKKQIREMIVFAVQNVIKDPPFSKIDMVSCRNLLIYLDTPLQKKVMPLFHYILRPDGVMLLGTSESIGEFTDFFSPFNNKWKIFKKMEGYLERAVEYPVMPFYHPRTDHPLNDKVNSDIDIQNVAERVILSEYSQPGVLVNEHYEIVHFLGKTDKYLETPIGKASFNVLSMAREGLRYKLSTTLNDAIRQKRICTSQAVRVKYNGSARIIDLTVRPLQEAQTSSGFFLVMFDEKIPDQKITKRKDKKEIEEVSDPAVTTLEQELNATKEHLQTTIEELETSNEELKSTNEELQSVNEELQSTNEELETSKEELQSTNEELVTVNTELQKKVDELSEANNDINNLLASTEIGTIFLDTELKIKRFTPAATKIFNLIVTDVGRSIRDITSNFSFEDFDKDVLHVIRTLEKVEKAVQDRNGDWFSVRIIPYRTLDNVIDGVVITFNDITKIKRAESDLEESEKRLKLIVENSEDVISLVDLDGKYLYFQGPSSLNLITENIVGKSINDVLDSSTVETVEEQIREVTKSGNGKYYETTIKWDDSTLYFMDYRYPVYNSNGEIIAVGTIGRNITQMKNKEEELKQVERNFNIALKNSSIIVAHVDLDLRYTWIYNPHPDFNPNTVIGKRDDELAKNKGVKTLVKLKKAIIKTGKPARKTITFPLSGGEITYDITAEPLKDQAGKIIGVTTASIDISNRK
jgi:two-component system, chemotaxis family, CheB/CheR fusion protein